MISVMHADPICIGINCALGPNHMKTFLANLSALAPYNVHAYPNAGLPNAMGGYDEDPETFGNNIMPFIEEGLLNMIGGCCGTTPEHIRSVSDRVK
mmetsp:Transcript_13694/g.2188  ORF Transcript_13694/g.2188 Transcript_13694/m.2188 type:complete len:96 (-) Transcript_13694:321-608(-)